MLTSNHTSLRVAAVWEESELSLSDDAGTDSALHFSTQRLTKYWYTVTAQEMLGEEIH